jgi:hypothetical protein
MRSVNSSAPVVLLTSFGAMAMAMSARAEDWSNTITPYLWGTSVQGTMAVGTPLGPLGGGVDLSSGDVFSHLKIGGMLDYRGENAQWAIIADALSADISAHGSKPVGPLTLGVTGGQQLTIVVPGRTILDTTLLCSDLHWVWPSSSDFSCR